MTWITSQVYILAFFVANSQYHIFAFKIPLYENHIAQINVIKVLPSIYSLRPEKKAGTISQLTFTSSKSTIVILEKAVKYVQR